MPAAVWITVMRVSSRRSEAAVFLDVLGPRLEAAHLPLRRRVVASTARFARLGLVSDIFFVVLVLIVARLAVMTLTVTLAVLARSASCTRHVGLKVRQLYAVLGLVANLWLTNRVRHVSLSIHALGKAELGIVVTACRPGQARGLANSTLRCIMTIWTRVAPFLI